MIKTEREWMNAVFHHPGEADVPEAEKQQSLPVFAGHLGEEGGPEVIQSAWLPTPDELELLQAGHAVVLTIWGTGRTWRLYGCARRGCDRVSLDFESFGAANGKGYCKSHIPLSSRVRLWWQERRG